MKTQTTTIIVDQYKDAAYAPAGTNSYKGLRIHALPGLHTFLAELLGKHARPGSTVLDLAAGSGAMSMRLQDLGYAVHAADYVKENFKPREIKFTQLDLNDDFSQIFREKKFDAIVASEIIEHLENPRHFLRQCYRTLAPGGIVVLSTPNIQCSASLASFVRAGEFLWFSDADYKLQGHITPLSAWQLGHCLGESGFKTRWLGSFGSAPTKMDGSPRLKLLAKLLNMASTIPAAQRGEILVCIAQKGVVSP